MEIIYLVITDRIYNYENLLIEKCEITRITEPLKKKRVKIPLDCYFVYYFVKELKLSKYFRNYFINYVKGLHNSKCLEFHLKPTTKDLIDYNWNDRIYVMSREKCELDHALSWLSTLGGAFSALGDYFMECAETAGKISVNQFKLALRFGDPQIEARCRLYYALSLIQRKQFKVAKRIIKNEFEQSKNAFVIDTRLQRMCKGIWAKLQYEHFLHIKQNEKSKLK